MSYETAAIHVDLLKTHKYGLIVCDEAHRLKNPRTKLYDRLSMIDAKMRIMVTGTPIQNDLDEFYSLLNFAIPNCLGDRKAFDNKYGKPILRSRDKECTDRELEVGQKASAAFFALIKQIMLRRTNEVIAKYLPAKLDCCVFITLTGEQQEMYSKVVEEGRKKYDGSYSSAFQTVTTLKKIVNDPALHLRARTSKAAATARSTATATDDEPHLD